MSSAWKGLLDSMRSFFSPHRTDGGRSPFSLPRAMAATTLLVASALLSAACSDKASGKPGSADALRAKAPVPVTVSKVIQKTVPVQLRAIGTAEAYTTVSIKAQVSGQVLRVHFMEGQDVKKGALLFTIDPRPFEATLRQAEANLARDEAQLRQAEATRAQKVAAEKEAEANLARDEARLENARLQAQRYQELIRDGAVSQEQYDQVRTTAVAMDATVGADRAAVENAKEGILAAQAAVSNAKASIQAGRAAIENARLEVEYSTIRAPMDGRTGNLVVHAGNLVKDNDDKTSLVVIHKIRPIYATFSVPEQYLSDIRKYLKAGTVTVEAIIPHQEGPTARGELTFVDNTVDPATGTIQLKATFPNSDELLWPGQFVNVILTLTTEPDAVVVPSQAVQTGQKGPYVFIVKSDLTTEPRPVIVKRALEHETVIRSGLKPGEQVVTEGHVRLFPGSHLEIKPSNPIVTPEAEVP